MRLLTRCKACDRRLLPWEGYPGAGGETICAEDVARYEEAKARARERKRMRERAYLLAGAYRRLRDAYREPGPTARKDAAKLFFDRTLAVIRLDADIDRELWL